MKWMLLTLVVVAGCKKPVPPPPVVDLCHFGIEDAGQDDGGACLDPAAYTPAEMTGCGETLMERGWVRDPPQEAMFRANGYPDIICYKMP